MVTRESYRVAIIGGTGPQGRALGYRFARHGHRVMLGSRSRERAEEAAAEVNARLDGLAGAVEVTPAENAIAVEACEVVVLAVPYDGHDELVAALPLAGRTVISCVNPLRFDKGGPVGRPVEGGESSAAETAAALQPEATLVGAFHHVSSVSLWSDAEYLDHEDVMVCGDSAEGKAIAIDLAESVTGRPGIDVGRLRLARQLEPLTAVLISINRIHKTQSGIRLSL